MTSKPLSAIWVSTASGGGAPAVKNSTVLGSARLSAAGADRIVDMTTGAPQRCVTPWSASASHTAFWRTARRQTCVPAITDNDQVKHQPLQWNMGSVHRYTACLGMEPVRTLPWASR